MVANLLSVLLTCAGLVFFVSGSVGMVRFPDPHSRLHALTKADNLGLGLILLGALAQAGSLFVGLKLVLIWVLALVASAVSAQTIARAALTPEADPDA